VARQGVVQMDTTWSFRGAFLQNREGADNTLDFTSIFQNLHCVAVCERLLLMKMSCNSVGLVTLKKVANIKAGEGFELSF